MTPILFFISHLSFLILRIPVDDRNYIDLLALQHLSLGKLYFCATH